MADYSPKAITVDGVAPTVNNAASGDKLTNPGDGRFLAVENGAVASMTLTVNPAGKTAYSVNNPPKVWTIAANGRLDIPVLAAYGDPADSGKVALTWSSTTTVTFSYRRI